MGRNIAGQINYAIGKNFKEKIDKKSFKENYGREMSSKIFSYEEKFRLKDMGRSLQKFLKENDINIKQVKEIKAEHIQKYLQDAKDRNCTQQTINTYSNSFFKLEKVLDRTFGVNLKWKSEVEVPRTEIDKRFSSNRGVKSVIKREDYNKILEYAEENKSQSGQALQMQDWLGVRVAEITELRRENINLEERTIAFKNTKGGKEFTREIPETKVAFIREVLNDSSDRDKVFNLSRGSINRYLNRVEDKLEIERHSMHDIRRLIAQEHYDNLRKDGDTPKEAMEKTSEWLNHGKNREELLTKSYIVLC